MSMRHILDAAEMDLPTAMKLVLMAIGDDASENTNRSYPGLEKIMTWAGVKERRALQLIELLVEQGLVTRVSTGFPGKRAVYMVSIPEAPRRPVYNSEKMDAISHETGEEPVVMGAILDEKVWEIAPLSKKTFKELNQSHTEPHLVGPVENSDDEIDPSGQLPLLARLRRRKAVKHLDVDELNTVVGPIFADMDDEQRRRIVYQVALRILGKAAKAGTDLADPTRYIAAAIANEPEVWRKVAFSLERAS